MKQLHTSQLKVKTSELAPGIWEIRIVGSVNFENASILDDAIRDALRLGASNLVIDLKRAAYIASSGFGCFLNAMAALMKGHGKLVFASTPTAVREVLCNLLGFSRILHFAKDSEAALAEFS